MRIESLPSPGLLSNGIKLRTEMAKAISAVEIQAGFASGKATYAKALTDFCTACIAALSTFVDSVVPTVTARTVTLPTGQSVRIRHSKGIDPQYEPPISAFAVSGKTISRLRIDGPDIILHLTVPYTVGAAGGTVSYTQPGTTGNVRDLSGNLLANYTTQAIVNGMV